MLQTLLGISDAYWRKVKGMRKWNRPLSPLLLQAYVAAVNTQPVNILQGRHVCFIGRALPNKEKKMK